MAKTSLVVRYKRPQKFKVREYTRCERCGRPHSVIRKFKLCRICLRELPRTPRSRTGTAKHETIPMPIPSLRSM